MKPQLKPPSLNELYTTFKQTHLTYANTNSFIYKFNKIKKDNAQYHCIADIFYNRIIIYIYKNNDVLNVYTIIPNAYNTNKQDLNQMSKILYLLSYGI